MEVSTRSRKSHPCASSGISLYPSKAASAKDGPLALSCHPPASPLPSWPCEAAYLFRCEAQLRSSSFFAAYPLIPASLSLLFWLPPSQPQPSSPYSSFRLSSRSSRKRNPWERPQLKLAMARLVSPITCSSLLRTASLVLYYIPFSRL